jgi:shikimate kinase
MSPPVRSIVLIGMMGAGKSSVGRCLEQRIGFPRFDTDEIVESKMKMPIPEIFARHGEEKFREVETAALRSWKSDRRAIIVTGGGIVTRSENIELLKEFGTVVWLDVDQATLRNRLNRLRDRPPLQTANPRATLRELLQKRNPLYRRAADIRVDTSNKSPEEIAEVILNSLENLPIGE